MYVGLHTRALTVQCSPSYTCVRVRACTYVRMHVSMN